MSRRRRRDRRGAPPAGPARPPARRRRLLPRTIVWTTVALVVAVALAWGPARRRARPPAAPAPPSPAAAALAGMPVESALRTALALGQARRELESLPYFEHAIRNARVDIWQTHYNYATGLYNSTLRIGSRNGLPSFAVRSSWERITLIREAVHQLELAERLARTGRDSATVRTAYAQMLWLWGMPWDAFVAYRQAFYANRADNDLAAQGDHLMDLMRYPTESKVTAPDLPARGPQ